ncbi:hypothetical protein SCA03_14130 [Streptomyces cacaoi]|uniref:Uncharacterized protein n=1 Tax=Streptomyces cacaoi TaxID=1898 RepID=A0A4Y3QUJ0_STRCI|nr:hypothetical protein SCA03_14130 [Streptomyces cacaoi]
MPGCTVGDSSAACRSRGLGAFAVTVPCLPRGRLPAPGRVPRAPHRTRTRPCTRTPTLHSHTDPGPRTPTSDPYAEPRFRSTRPERIRPAADLARTESDLSRTEGEL